MFQSKNNRYVTRGVDDSVTVETKFFLWSLIYEQVQKGDEVDYFQIFELKISEDGQEILHSQEETEWSHKTLLEIPKECCVNKVIWVIDSVEYQTMLFPEEY